eukprot:TRINITY_DN1983_c2_g1_i1.p1 TRINITY_DN1983_c2_g1~~TRINITY_DN1983_c2_g1_i1.p1  ORF type:complete len:806 (+),score=245.03 TRINITY_DN1983_c2_g1_i1:54-2471(+)
MFKFGGKKTVTRTSEEVKAPTTRVITEELIADDKSKYTYGLDEMLEIRKHKMQDVDYSPEGLIENIQQHNLEEIISKGSMSVPMCNIVNSRNTIPVNADEGRAGLFGSEKQQVDTGIGSLQTSEDAYRIKTATELSSLDKIRKFVNGVLNKLTPEKYETLSEQLTTKEEIINDEECMNLTIELIFDRAANQPSFCEMYASLSKRISDAERLAKKDLDNASIKFRNQFLKVVQNEFERCKKILEKNNADPDKSEEEREAEELKAKKRQLGNVQFVGELYKTNMLSNKVIHWVIPEILFKKDRGGPEPEEIEVLCKLLNTVGKVMESRKIGDNFDHSARIDEYFAEMQKLSHNPRFEKRIQFSIINTIEARANGWPAKAGTAKKLKDLEKEADESERKKLAGQSTVSHSGESNAWGSGAIVHKSVGGKKKDDSKAKAAKKNAAKDEWQTTGNSKKGTKNTAKQAAGGKGGGTPQPQPTKSNAYSSISQGGDKKKKKKEKNDKKEKKQSRDRDDDEKKAKDKPPMEIDESFRAKVGQRAMDCMMGTEKEALLQEDMEHYQEFGFENLCPVVVMEVLRAIAVEKDEESSNMLFDYIVFLTTTPHFKRDDIMRGISYFICNSAMEDLLSDKPNAYRKAAVALKKLLPTEPEESSDFSGYKEINSVFRNSCRMIKLCFNELDEEDRPYEYVHEIYANVVEGLWCPLHKDMKFETDVEKKVDTILNALIGFNHKTVWPVMFDDTPVIAFMMKYLIEEVQLFDAETLASVFSGMKHSSKTAQAGKLLKDYVGGGEEEEAEEVEEDEEEVEEKE